MKFLPLSFFAAIFVFSILWLIITFTMLPMHHEVRLQELQFQSKDFAAAEALAFEHFGNGKYQLIWGHGEASEETFLLDSILRAEYNVEVVHTGCVGTTDEVYHYSFVMAFQLANEHGHDFFDKARTKANEIVRAKTSGAR